MTRRAIPLKVVKGNQTTAVNSKKSTASIFTANNQPFVKYPDRKPKEHTPILVCTKDHLIFDVLAINTGFGIEFINEIKHTHLSADEIKGWWYIK